MDAAQALADLTEISAQIEAAVIVDRDGTIVGSTLDGGRATELGRTAQELVAAVERVSPEADRKLAQAEVATGDGSVFLVRDDDRTIVATTKPEPAAGLVFYDLKSCLRSAADEPAPKPKPKRAPRKKATEGNAEA